MQMTVPLASRRFLVAFFVSLVLKLGLATALWMTWPRSPAGSGAVPVASDASAPVGH
jgi:hypothetical protein